MLLPGPSGITGQKIAETRCDSEHRSSAAYRGHRYACTPAAPTDTGTYY